MSTFVKSLVDTGISLRRWGLDYVITPESPLRGQALARWLRTTAELPIQLRRIGWASIGFVKHQQDSLASHHHQVTLQVLLVGSELKRLNIPFNLPLALEMGMTHDLSEYGGGDYSSSRANAYPEQKADCRIIEARNREKLCSIIGDNHPVAKRYLQLATEEMNQTNDEAVVVKICDRLEAMLHLRRVRPYSYIARDEKYYRENIQKLTDAIKNPELKQFMERYIESFLKLDQAHKLGGQSHDETGDQLTDTDRLVVTCDNLQMMKHVDRTAWAVGGLQNSDFDTIADHGHATAIGTWSMATALEGHRIQIKIREAMILALIQEVGKINGGDVAVASNNPTEAERAAAHRLRKGSFKGSMNLLHPDIATSLAQSHEDALRRNSDEAKLMMTMSRLMDYMHYDLVHKPNYTNRYKEYTGAKILSLAETISDPQLRFVVVRTIKEMIFEIESGELRRTIHALMGSGGSYVLK